jgi:hypothetical protein
MTLRRALCLTAALLRVIVSDSRTMIRAILLIAMCLTLSSCETVRNIQNDERLSTIGSFELNPVQPNNYWYNGKSCEYNEYEIEITAGPGQAKIQWSGKTIGTTPFIYRFTGILDKDEYIKVRAIPIDGNLPAQEAMFRVRKELPRKIHFDLGKKQEGQ